ncbi:MAG TPA: haloacid dehalogenase type II [Anaerolineales bacterium]|nr:haloacid dehalogenase type II [Anaerolineales bacterium]
MSRVIVFDLVGTLLDLRTMDQHFERFFGDASVRKEWFMQTIQLALATMLTNTYEDFGVQADTALEITARHYKVSMLGEEKNLILGTLRKLRPYPDVAPSLQRLRDAGLRLAALTNSTVAAAEAQLEFAGLSNHFEQVIYADEVQSFKPAPSIYHHAASRLGVEPKEMRLVSAHHWDVTGALQAGCAAAFVARPGQVMNPFGPQPDMKASDLSELIDKILEVELAPG